MSNIKKGDVILYKFAYSYVEAKVIKVYDEDFIKVRHNDLPFIINFLVGYVDIIETSKVLSKISRSGEGDELVNEQ